MKNLINIIKIFVASSIVLLAGCEKHDYLGVNVVTSEVSEITTSTAKSGGNIISEGVYEVIERGVCWSTSKEPTISTTISNYTGITSDGVGTGEFTSELTGLAAGTTYYVRAYFTNTAGETYYGNQVSFTTTSDRPIVKTSQISSYTETSAVCGGTVVSQGLAAVTARGVCWSTSHNPTISGSHTTDGTGTGSFSSSITGVSSYYTYYVRAYATNSYGTSYGEEVVLNFGYIFKSNFENNAENSKWYFANGGYVNMWCIGSATDNGGSKSLYITNNGGQSYGYSTNRTSYVYAYRLVTLPETDDYLFSFDWKAYGESGYDYLRVYLVPNNCSISAGITPQGHDNYSEGWIKLDDGTRLWGNTSWRRFSVRKNVSAGTYKLVFYWTNDGGGGSQPPAAIDNVSIEVR